ncbi:MAG: EAL domain-containing protein [Xenococcaceae cyanobacterium]
MTRIKILIVEDEPILALDLANKLRKLECEIIDIVSTGEAAVNLVEKAYPDLIFMDIKLKGAIDGIETARQILQIKDIPIVYLTGYVDEATVERAEATGCYGYMIKPCKEVELYATIKIVLKKHAELAKVKTFLSQESAESPAQLSSYYNSLTQLPNLLSLQEEFIKTLQKKIFSRNYHSPKSALQDSNSNNFKIAAIAYLNVDRFYRINNDLGYKYGNLLLQQIARRLQTSLDEDILIAHLNTDEFVLVFLELEQRKSIISRIEWIRQQFNQPFLLHQREVFLTVSIGIAVYPWNGTEIEKLLQKAYRAMNQAKHKGGNQYQFYQAAVETRTDTLALETDLRYALGRKELQLRYQPQISLKTGRIIGVEALIRWHHPHKGIISPSIFIPLAEQTGLINAIGKWVLQQACQQMKTWQVMNLDINRIAVNLSASQFNQANLGKTLIKILKKNQLDSQCLELELTESTLIANLDLTIHQLNNLKSLGIKVSVDDFGTGYSSLSYLQKFPFDILKIDRSFIKDIDRNGKNATITKNLIHLAHQLHLKVIAEGVETQAELNFLIKNKCDEVQGYFLSRPLLVEEFEQLFREQNLRLPTIEP